VNYMFIIFHFNKKSFILISVM